MGGRKDKKLIVLWVYENIVKIIMLLCIRIKKFTKFEKKSINVKHFIHIDLEETKFWWKGKLCFLFDRKGPPLVSKLDNSNACEWNFFGEPQKCKFRKKNLKKQKINKTKKINDKPQN